MVNVKKIKNTENADGVRQKINDNFDILSKHFSSRMLSLTKTEMDNIEQDYLREGLIVYNTTDKKFYTRSGNSWELYKIFNTFTSVFYESDWEDGYLSIPYGQHKVDVKNVSVYISTTQGYMPVLIDVVVDSMQNVILNSDVVFDGKVVLT